MPASTPGPALARDAKGALILPAASPDHVLSVKEARLEGKGLSLEPSRNGTFQVRGLGAMDQSVRWTVRLARKSTFTVELAHDFYRKSVGSRFRVRLGSETLHGAVTPTYIDPLNIGRVTLEAGAHEIVLAPVDIKGDEAVRPRALLLTRAAPPAAGNGRRDWRRTSLSGAGPTGEILRLDIDGDGKPDILERWWNGRRVRWLDENGDLQPTDMRGDVVADVLQIDMDGDGFYDGAADQNIKWADNDGDGQADVQAFALNGRERGNGRREGGHWMLFIDTDRDGVYGWEDWQAFDFNCWGYTGMTAWLPDYNGESVFLKMHAEPKDIEDLTLNWENPFSFYDTDGDGLSEMAMRWLDPPKKGPDGIWRLTGKLNEAFAAFDLDNDSGRDNEIDFDLSFRVKGPGIDYRELKHSMAALKGQPRFDACFAHNGWRRVDAAAYMPHEQGWGWFGERGRWTQRWLVFDEDDDDHRWERVELYYPAQENYYLDAANGSRDLPATLHSTERWSQGPVGEEMKTTGKPGFSGHTQADSLGDRGEFDRDDSGRGQLYVGVFDRKLHLYGAEWGVWTVDREARYHGGWREPTRRGDAPRVEEAVKYTDTDANGFLDTVEFDYEGDGAVDLKVSLLDYKSASLPAPDVAPLIDTQAAGWGGLREAFTKAANDAWREALLVYRAAWRRGLTTPELDKLANAASVAQRYESAYWIKEQVFRIVRARAREARLTALEADLIRLYYLGRFDEYVKKVAEVPSS